LSDLGAHKSLSVDGTPYAVKAARMVWSGGKVEDNFKNLPIAIRQKHYKNGRRCQ